MFCDAVHSAFDVHVVVLSSDAVVLDGRRTSRVRRVRRVGTLIRFAICCRLSSVVCVMRRVGEPGEGESGTSVGQSKWSPRHNRRPPLTAGTHVSWVVGLDANRRSALRHVVVDGVVVVVRDVLFVWDAGGALLWVRSVLYRETTGGCRVEEADASGRRRVRVEGRVQERRRRVQASPSETYVSQQEPGGRRRGRFHGHRV